MNKRRLTTVFTVIIGLAPISFGLRFLLDPHGAASGFGIDPWPTGNEAGYFIVKAVRDIVCGLNILVLLALGQRRATGVVMGLAAIIPVVDMVAVLTHGGSVATALGIHGLTAVVVAIAAVVLLRERQATPAAQPVPVAPADQSVRVGDHS
ncbi:DUF4267 domain-containing protein [Kribbella sp. VKM Ac-2568]|uniref:DUF4267 domain-containing protein n=1 Tax=Kribbella sp. VKM Ac-2568 TaxID=2512219 RepID=UPI00104D4D03|nr:DUF4267 domain-containing protein [Kribbella sp. VKM Ac-2568]TCM48026.1 uncharacterized protein DUF4267 [Kribbella sp. VKM Ac-2568]